MTTTLTKRKKLAFYALLVGLIILGLLLSMLNLSDSGDYPVGKWAIAGILAILVAAVFLLGIPLSSRRARHKLQASAQLIEIVVVPLSVIVLAAVVLVVFGYEDLSERLFTQPPFLPFALPFLASIVGHRVRAYFSGSE